MHPSGLISLAATSTLTISCKEAAKAAKPSGPIAENRRARYDYHVEERHEAGMVLAGWEIKAIRAGQVQLTDGYVLIKDGELYLIGCRINALRSASTHVSPEVPAVVPNSSPKMPSCGRRRAKISRIICSEK